MASGKIAGTSTTKTIGSYVNTSSMFNITNTKSSYSYYQDKFGIVGTSDILWTPWSNGGRWSYASNEDFAVSNLDTGSLSGMAKTGASSGNSMVVNLKGATQTGLSGKTAGSKYYVDSSGALVVGLPSTTPSAFLGTGVSSSEILVGEELIVPQTSTDSFANETKSLTKSGWVANSNDIVTGFGTFLQQNSTNATNVSATGTSALLTVTGAGIVKYFIVSHNSNSNGSTNLAVFIDDVQVLTTGDIQTKLQRPLSLVGDFRGGVNGAGYHGSYLTNGDLRFNSKFEVKNNSGTVTSFTIAYKIEGV